MKRGRLAGFTLMELMISLSMSAVIIAGATSAMVSITRSTVQTRQQSHVDIEAKLLVDWIASSLQEVGGGNIRPEMAIEIEDDCASDTFDLENVGSTTLPDCDESDRLNFLLIEDGAPQCRVTGTAGVNLQMDPSDPCCQAGNTDLDGRTVLVVDASGNWETRFCSNQVTGAGCHCVFPPGQSAYNPPGGAFNDADGAYITLGSSATVYLAADHILKMLVDTDGDGSVELLELAPNVYDFQATLLWDTDNNGSPETESIDIPAGGTASMLRMLRVGLVMGATVPSRTTASSGQVLNGPTRTVPDGVLLRSVVASTGLRNLFVFY